MNHIEQLQRTAQEIRAEGHAGWGNVCDDAATRIAELESLLQQAIHIFDTMEVDGLSPEWLAQFKAKASK